MLRHLVCVDGSRHNRKQGGGKEPAIVNGLKRGQNDRLCIHGLLLLLNKTSNFNQEKVSQ